MVREREGIIYIYLEIVPRKLELYQVDPVLVGLRRLRSDAEHLRKQGVGLNGTEKVSSWIYSLNVVVHSQRSFSQVKVLEEATMAGALVEILGLASFFKAVNDDEALASEVDDDAIDVANLTSTKTRSGQTV